MKKNMTMKNKIILVLFAVIIVTNAIYFYVRYNATYDIQCDGYVSYRASQDEFGYDVVITLNLRNDASGLFGIEGIMRKGNDTWTLNRDVTFFYHQQQPGAIRLEEVHIIKHGRDNSPDEIFDRNFFSLKDEASRSVSLVKLMDSYVIGTLRAPIFTCISHQR